MAIEKMALVSIEGTLRRVNKTLLKCCETENFHIIQSAHGSDDYYSSQSFKTLKDKNLFAPIVKRGRTLAEGLGIELKYTDYDDIDFNVSVDFSEYFEEIEDKFSQLSEKRSELTKLIEQHSVALMQIEQLSGLDSDFEDIFALKYIKVRFGRLPMDSYPKLKYFEDRPFEFFPFETAGDYIWGVYFTPRTEAVITDDIFKSIYFERIRIPDYVSGTADDAKSRLLRMVNQEQESLDEVNTRIADLKKDIEERFLRVFTKLQALSDSFSLRANVAVINNRFFLSGYVPESYVEKFIEHIKEEGLVSVQTMPVDSDPRTSPPVKLKNLWLFRPFEMFVKMYGLPMYGRMDPTPFVAITYMIIYGIMFGDVGQGLLVSLLGFILTKWKNVKLGPIMTRIGISSAFFGIIYGSVFGNEHIITPFYHRENIYKLLGYDSMPKDIFEVSIVLLLTAIAIGVFLIIFTMFMNVINSLRYRDFENAIFGSNGLAGLVLYLSLIAGVAFQFGLGYSVFTAKYVLLFIILPLVIMFFKEPINHLTLIFQRRNYKRKVRKNSELVNAISSYSSAVTDIEPHSNKTFSLDELIDCKYIKYQYGKMTLENYEKLKIFSGHQYFFFPFESIDDCITGIYIAPDKEFPSVDRIFSNLNFEKMKTPAYVGDILTDIKSRNKQASAGEGEDVEKLNIGTFVIEGFIELFETMLTYITNTMSYIRIGGFILSHAGLMLVVNTLANMAGSDGSVAYIIVQIVGNLFVTGLEGFLVGVQVLRLEFYEMFSRFYKANGTPFKPVVVDLKPTE